MLTLLLGIMIFVLFTLIGIVIFSLLKIDKDELLNTYFILLAPILGALVMVCFGETLLLIFPLKYTGYLFLITLIYLIIKVRKDLHVAFNSLIIKRLPILISIFGGIVTSFPVLKNINFVSIQGVNNDIAFYFSSMDCLYSNNFFQSIKILVDPRTPYYSLALFMIKNTRIGTEVLGAQLMSLTFLKPHQLYFPIGIALVISCIMVCGFFVNYVCKVNSKYTLLLMLFASCSFFWNDLMMMQYVPQIFGIGSMISFLAVLLHSTQYRKNTNIVLLGITLAGTLSVYCEFSVYLFVFFLLSCLLLLIGSKNKKEASLKVINIIKGCLLIFMFSPLGVYKALKFNLMLLNNLKSTSNIDPFNGEIMTFPLVLQNLFGLSLRNVEVLGRFPFYLALVIIFVFILTTSYILIKKHNLLMMILFLILEFFILYEISFRNLKFAYGEYKHIFSIIPIILCIFSVFIYYTFEEFPVNKAKKLKVFILLIYIICMTINLNNIYKLYSIYEIFYYDNDIISLRNEASRLPKNSTFKLDGSYNDIHAGVYALKNHNVYLLEESYYGNISANTKINLNYPIYELILKSKKKSLNNGIDITNIKPVVIWENNKYGIIEPLLESKPIGIKLIEGFYPIEESDNNLFRWTNSRKSTFLLKNNSKKSLNVELILDISGAASSDKNITISLENGKLIGRGKTPSKIKTAVFNIEPKGETKINILTEENLTKIGQDERMFGIYVKKINVYTR